MIKNPHRNFIAWRLFMKHFACSLIVFLTVLAICNIPFAETDTEYDKALKYYNSGKYKEAVELLKNYVQTKPEPSAYYRIGYALYKLKKFNEADEYFKMTYLIDPMFSPQQHGLPERPDMPFKESAESMPEQAAPKPMPPESKQPSHESQPQKAQEPTVTPPEKPSLPEPQMVKPPQGSMQPPAGFQPFPGLGKEMQGLPPGVPMGLVASLGIMIYLIAFAIYIFTSLCLFLIAKKLNVPAPWTAWIPIIQVWTFVTSAGKAWWWILLLLIPIVNTIVGIYLWICITENLGRNKWLGLLMLLPLINLVFLGILAFSKTEQPGYTGMGATTA
jgi:hypothetical protein